MAWNDVASNQMVSFTDAQASGFTLKSGQSQVTSNQCMTKAEILAKYNVSATNISGYANNQLVPKGAWVASGFSGIMMVGGYDYQWGYGLEENFGAMTNTDLSDVCGPNAVLTKLCYNVGGDFLRIDINNGTTWPSPVWFSVQIGATTYFRSDFRGGAYNGAPINAFVWNLDTNNNAIGTTMNAAKLVIIK